MTQTINDDLVVAGAISAANFAFGSVVVSPQVNTPTSQEVGGLNLRGTGEAIVLLTAVSEAPWTHVQEVSHRFNTPTGFTAYIFRTSGVDTTINWLTMLEATL
ncbi:hypothetical protein [Streptomyces termitum]|uniref:hypothetical protein n=1 Tax=Streptomyces termitum TaxID=67368 RepID=UPI0033AFA642